MGLFTPARCQLCTTPLRRRYYTWTTPQGTASVCPKCNTRLENMKSRAVFDPLETLCLSAHPEVFVAGLRLRMSWNRIFRRLYRDWDQRKPKSSAFCPVSASSLARAGHF